MEPSSSVSREPGDGNLPDSVESDFDFSDVDPRFVDALAEFDELLRVNDTAALALSRDSALDNSQLRDAQACLGLLQLAFPRRIGVSNRDETAATGKIGRFELLRVLGQGGFGIVYLARDPQLDRLVALKVPRLHILASDALYTRFLREARAAAGLEHPHIVPVLETSESRTQCYIASVFCDGPNLAQWIKEQGGPIPVRIAARIVTTISEATHFSHERGILHRDLKPSNVLLAKRSAGWRRLDPDDLPFVPRVTDFGLAKFTEPGVDETRTSALLGTPLYVSPEQARCSEDEIGRESDVYSLGVILYELLTGRPPFQGTNFADVIDQIRAVDPVPPSRLVSGIPRDLETICLKCLHKNPVRRYRTAGALADDLVAFLEHRTITARPGGLVETAAKWIRRRPTAAVLIGMTALFFVSLVLLQWRHSRILKENLQTTLELRKVGLEREGKLRLLFEATETEAGGRELYSNYWQSGLNRWNRLVATASPERALGAGIEPEWNHVWNQLKAPTPLLTLRGHSSAVLTVTASPDGDWIVSGDAEGMVKVWERKSGHLIQSIKAHPGEVRALTFSPDGQRLATGGQFHFVKIWNTADWHLEKEFDAHDGTTTCLHFSASGTTLASGGRDGVIHLWDAKSWTKQVALELGNVVNRVHLSADERSLLTTDKDRQITIWTCIKEKVWKRSPLCSVGSNPFSLAATTDGKFGIAAAGSDIVTFNTVTKSVITLNKISRTLAACMASDGSWGVLTGREGVIEVLRFGGLSDGPIPFHVLSQSSFVGHDCHVRDVAAVPGLEQFVTGDNDGVVKLWSIDSIQSPSRYFLPGHPGGVNHLAISNDSTRLASCGKDGQIRLYSTTDFQLIATLDWSEKQCQFTNVFFDPDNQSLFACSDLNGSSFVYWDPKSASAPRVVAAPPFIAATQSKDGRLLAYVELDAQGISRQVVVRDVETLTVIRTVMIEDLNAQSLTFSDDCKRLAIGGQDLCILNLETSQIATMDRFDGSTLIGLAFDPQGLQLTASGHAGTIWRVDSMLRTSAHPFQLGIHDSKSDAIDISPDGEVLAVAMRSQSSPSGTVIVWHFDAERTALMLELYGHRAGCVKFAPNGRFLAAGLSNSPPIKTEADLFGVLIWRLDPPRAPRAIP